MDKKINSNISGKVNGIKYKFGCTDKHNTTTFYVNTNTYITPVNDKTDYKILCNKFFKNMQTYGDDICKKYSNILDKQYLFDCDTAYKHMNIGKYTFLDVNYNFKLKNKTVFKKLVSELSEELLNDIVNKMKTTIEECAFSAKI